MGKNKLYRVKKVEHSIPVLDDSPSAPLRSEAGGELPQMTCSFYRDVRFLVQMKLFFFWITVKSFTDKDEEWAKMCAEELLDKLNEKL